MVKNIFIYVALIFSSLSFINEAKARRCSTDVANMLIYYNAICTGPGFNYRTYIFYDYIGTAYMGFDCYYYGNLYDWSWVGSGCTTDLRVTKAAKNIRRPVKECGSIIQTGSQVLGESIPVVGTSFNLNYFSNRVLGRVADYQIRIPISADIVDSNVTGYSLEIKDDLGNTIYTSSSFGTTTNQVYSYNTSGLNGSSIEPWTMVEYTTNVTEVGSDFSWVDSRKVQIGSLKNKKLGLGGWIPSMWRYFDSATKILYSPDGTERIIESPLLIGSFYYIGEEDSSVVYVFDSTGKIVETKLGVTGQVIYSFYYDGSDRLSYINEPFSKTTTFNRNGSGVLTSITAPNGKTTAVTMDGNGYLSTVTNPNSEVYEMTYHGTKGLLASFEKPNAALSEFTYDSLGNLIKDEHSGGREINLSKTTNLSGTFEVETETGMGRVETLSSNNNDTTYIQELLKADGSKYKITYTSNSDQQIEHNGSFENINYSLDTRFNNSSSFISNKIKNYFGSRLTSYNNNITLNNPSDPFDIDTWVKTTTVGYGGAYPITSTYDGSTKITSTSTNLGKTSTTEIDNYQRPVSIQQGNLNTVNLSYTNDKLTQISQSTRDTTFTYNSTSKLLETITNELSQTTTYTYNSAERLTKTTLPDSREINYVYDSRGNLTSITPPSKPAHTMTIGADELITSYNPPTLVGTVNTTYTYNLDNQLTEIARPDSQLIEYDYDSTSGRLDKITVPAGDYLYTYGLLGSNISLPTKIEAPDASSVELTYTYGVLSSVTVKDATPTTIYGYNASSSQHAQLNNEYLTGYGNYFSTDYTYDGDEYLSQAGDIVLTYNTPNGQLETTTLGDIGDTWAYNAYGELEEYEAKYNSTSIYKTELTRDGIGRVSQKIETLNSVTSTYDYTYDSAGRLTQVNKNSSTIATYSYDTNSNRTGGNNGTTITATYDNQDRMTAYKNYTFTYNANGDLTSTTNTSTNQTTSYTYDVFGNLRQVVLPSKTITYEIDPLNRRLGKSDGVTSIRYAYDNNNRLIAEIDTTTGDLTRRYVYASKSHVPDYFIDTNSDKFRIITDHLGSVRLVVKESTGVVQQRMEHDEFGRIITDTNPGYQPFGFAGGIYDHETALIRFGARDYMPSAGRWTSKDPIRFNAGDTNLFGYVFNDPVNFMDPSGLETAYVSVGLTYGAASPTYSNNGSSTSASAGVGYDTSSGFFTFNNRSGGTETYGAFAGVSVGAGLFMGNKDQFNGPGISTSTNVGVGLAGAGFTIFKSGGLMGYQFDLFGPGFGIGAFNQQNQCGGN